MASSTPLCFNCGKPLDVPDGPVGRGESCPNCGTDVRCCKNCAHYDERSYNECREPVAERVVDKDRSNFCDYYSLAGGSGVASGESKDDVLKKLDDLFK